MTIQELQDKFAGIVAGMREILETAEGETRDLSDDESVKYDEMKAEAESVKASIVRAEEVQAMEAAMAQPQERKISAVNPNEVPNTHVTAVRQRYSKLKAFKGKDAEDKAYRAGQWAMASLFDSEKAKTYCRDNGIQIQNAAGGDVNTKGGFLVPEEFNQTIIDLRESYGVARQECNVIPMARDTLTIPRRTGGLTAYFTDENPGSAITESDLAWDNVSLTARKLATLSRMSSEINEDSIINFADTLANEIAYAFATKEDDCVFNGDGTSTYGGIVGVRPKIIDGNHTVGAVDVATATHNIFSEIDATDLATLMAALPKYALPTAKWYISQAGYSMVFERLVQAAGGNTINDMSAGATLRYMGYPIVISQSMPAGVATDYDAVAMLLFGDLRMAATLGDRRGTTVAVSNDRYFDTDQIGIRGTERFDANVHDLGDTSTAGPIVALIGSSS